MSKSILRRMCADPAANVGIFLALAAVPLVTCAGAAMDYIHANQQRTELQARLDTAVLAAVSTSASGKAVGKRRVAAERMFRQNCSNNDCNAKLKLTFDGSKVRGRADFDMPTAFMRVVGINKMPISAVAEAAMGQEQYHDVYLAMDISESMGIGATVEDQLAMQASFGCVFACHIDKPTGTNGPGIDTNLERARALGVPIRLDATKEAAIKAIDYLERAGMQDYVRVGVYPFHNQSGEAVAPTSSNDRVRSELAGLQLADNLPKAFVADDAGDTYAGRLFDMIEAKIKGKGNGSKSAPHKLVVYLSDGAVTNRYPDKQFKTSPIDPRLCDDLRKRGAIVAVVHTNITFAGPQTDWGYNKALRPVEDQLAPNMQACADAGMYFRTETPDDIIKAFEKIVAGTIVEVPRLVR